MRINMPVREFHCLKKDVYILNSGAGGGNKGGAEAWSKPDSGWLKINCDGAFDSVSMIVAYGVIVRNSFGEVVGGSNRKRVLLVL